MLRKKAAPDRRQAHRYLCRTGNMRHIFHPLFYLRHAPLPLRSVRSRKCEPALQNRRNRRGCRRYSRPFPAYRPGWDRSCRRRAPACRFSAQIGLSAMRLTNSRDDRRSSSGAWRNPAVCRRWWMQDGMFRVMIGMFEWFASYGLLCFTI